MTELRTWWEPALGDIISGKIKDIKDSEIGKELEAEGKNGEDIRLLKIIKDNQDDDGIEYFENGKLKNEEGNNKITEFTKKVNAAYGQLKEILGAAK